MQTNLIVFVVVFGAIAIAFGPGFLLYRLARFRARLRKELAAQGYSVHALHTRWLTRGPFPDMSMPGIGRKKPEYLFRVLAAKRGGVTQSGWVRWRVPLWWHRDDQWAVKWDDTAESTTKGVSSFVFYPAVLLVTAVVMVLIVRTEAFAMFLKAFWG